MKNVKYKLVKSGTGLNSTAKAKIKFNENDEYIDVLEYEKFISIENDKKLYVEIYFGKKIYNGEFELGQYGENLNIEFRVYPQEIKKAEIIINDMIYNINIE